MIAMLRALNTTLCVKVSPAIAAMITHPPVIDFEVFTRSQALYETIKSLDIDITASGAATTNR